VLVVGLILRRARLLGLADGFELMEEPVRGAEEGEGDEEEEEEGEESEDEERGRDLSKEDEDEEEEEPVVVFVVFEEEEFGASGEVDVELVDKFPVALSNNLGTSFEQLFAASFLICEFSSSK